MALNSEDDLAGLPDGVRDAAKRAATDLGVKGENPHAITLARSSVESFLTFSDRRDLREKAFKAWIKRAEKSGSGGNPAILSEAIELRTELANILGFDSYADYALSETMAKTPDAVAGLLKPVWDAAKDRASEERDALQTRAKAAGQNEPLEAWDWRYYAEKERKSRFDIDESEIRPYLELDNMIEAAFHVAGRLFGLSFKEQTDAERYHPDVRVFEVTDTAGDHVALFYGDYFARPSKRSGAWMSRFRSQHNLGSKPTRPIIVNVMNFARGGDGEPTLLSFDDARTLFHEFGHGLHGMLSDVTYPSLSGTAVSRDFVELPSQLYEHWLGEPEVLRQFAKHYKTGKPMPNALLKRLKAAENFNQGFATVEYTACALLDMELHTRGNGKALKPGPFERKTLAELGMPQEIVMRHRLPHFMHIMGGYAAGYYSYMWSEVMDADAFAAFKEAKNIFDPETAERLKTHIYSAGNAQDPELAYLAFRGRAPSIDGLLKKRGFAT
ncbi:MAG: M3 family metallopeptidase, partial [Pseudomonadota bacterium]